MSAGLISFHRCEAGEQGQAFLASCPGLKLMCQIAHVQACGHATVYDELEGGAVMASGDLTQSAGCMNFTSCTAARGGPASI